MINYEFLHKTKKIFIVTATFMGYEQYSIGYHCIFTFYLVFTYEN